MQTVKHRYQRVIQNRQKAKQLLQKHMQLSAEKYHEMVFEVGVAFAHNYWQDYLQKPHIKALCKQMLTDEKVGFWRWFINHYEAAQLAFTYEIQPVFADDLREYGKDEAVKRLYDNWLDFQQSEIINNDDLHERLRVFIVENIEKWNQ